MVFLRYSLLLLTISVILSCQNRKSTYQPISQVPDLEMPDNHLKFKTIENYKNYKVIATHFRTDKNELRYIMANNPAYQALNEKRPLSDGSIIVKIGWDIKQMPNFKAALEANHLKRIEYMIKDKKQFGANPGNWGYARFVKSDNQYQAWKKGTASCISCHNIAKENDFMFTKLQKLD